MSAKAPDPVFVLRGPQAPVTAVTFLCTQQQHKDIFIAAGTQDGKVFVWSFKTKCKVKEWIGHPDTSIPWLHSASPGILWTQGRCDSVKEWNIESSPEEVLATYPLIDYLGFSSSCIIHVNSYTKLLSTPGPSQEAVTVWDASKKIKIAALVPSDPKAYGTVMQPRWITTDGAITLAVMYESGHIALWDWANSKIVNSYQIAENPMCFTFDESSRTGMIGTASEKLYVFSIKRNLNISIEKELSIMNAGVSSCIMRPDGKLFVTGGWDSRIRVFSTKKCKALAVLMYHKKTVECVAYSENYSNELYRGFLFAAGSSDKSVSLWNIFN